MIVIGVVGRGETRIDGLMVENERARLIDEEESIGGEGQCEVV